MPFLFVNYIYKNDVNKVFNTVKISNFTKSVDNIFKNKFINFKMN